MTIHTTQPALSRMGFTLIELSIVLVIIGLIVGGVLVGQDLIKAAEVRATIGQYEKYNSAINTFRTKYNGMPGDLLNTQASAFGLYQYTGTAGSGFGDGNGLLESSATNLNAPVGEPAIFWRHLSDASLVDGSFGADIVTTSAELNQNIVTLYFPGAKLGRGNTWIVGSSAGFNFYGLTGLSAVTKGPAGTAFYTQSYGQTPIEAFNIDTKLDDGMPNTGIVQARATTMSTTVDGIFGALAAGNAASWAASPAAGNCTTTGGSATASTDTYARGTTPGNSPGCNLRLRFN